MRRLAAPIFLLLLLSAVAVARPGTDSNYNSAISGGGGGYTGPGDVVSGAEGWWGLRGYSAAYSTGSNPAAIVCNATTFTTCVTVNILSNGSFDVATASGSAACATTCVVKQLYDQSGNGFHMTCGSAAACPTLTFSCIGALPCMTFAGGVQSLSNASLPILTQPYSSSGEFKYTNTTTGGLWGGGGGFGVEPTNTNLVWYCSNAVNTASAVNTQYDFGTVCNGASSGSNLNGTYAAAAGAGTATTGSFAGWTFGADHYDVLSAGQMEETGIWNIAFTTTQLTNLHNNLSSYW